MYTAVVKTIYNIIYIYIWWYIFISRWSAVMTNTIQSLGSKGKHILCLLDSELWYCCNSFQAEQITPTPFPCGLQPLANDEIGCHWGYDVLLCVCLCLVFVMCLFLSCSALDSDMSLMLFPFFFSFFPQCPCINWSH